MLYFVAASPFNARVYTQNQPKLLYQVACVHVEISVDFGCTLWVYNASQRQSRASRGLNIVENIFFDVSSPCNLSHLATTLYHSSPKSSTRRAEEHISLGLVEKCRIHVFEPFLRAPG